MKLNATIDVKQYRDIDGRLDTSGDYDDKGLMIAFGNDTAYITLENIPPDQTQQVEDLQNALDSSRDKLSIEQEQVGRLMTQVENLLTGISFLFSKSQDHDTLVRDLLEWRFGDRWNKNLIQSMRYIRSLRPVLTVSQTVDLLKRCQQIGQFPDGAPQIDPSNDPNQFDGSSWFCRNCKSFHLTRERWEEQERDIVSDSLGAIASDLEVKDLKKDWESIGLPADKTTEELPQ